MDDKSNQQSERSVELSADVLTLICGGVSAYKTPTRRGSTPAADDVIVDGRIITAENYDS